MGTEGQKSWHIVDIIVVVNYQGILVEGSTSQFFYAKGFQTKNLFIYFKITHFSNPRILNVLN